ncbi:ParB family protein [Pseudomonas huaxiensis]|uniref:ParB family protein n=1 Tax=Pseudomonas huaxiensis TaxID=2213017 RepID=UPI000DA64159|nr:ParB family protein [Pseudomonas huaxiensis]
MAISSSDETDASLTALLKAEVFQHSGQNDVELKSPLADRPVSVTLDQLLPYDRNPRKIRNPKYEEIKASIRERGLDAPPGITQRPGESGFRIYSGGTTRLSILRELWTETKEERFFRISCLLRPWPARGDIVVLTGHLAENDMRGHLTFIERALGVEDASALYESECGKALSQSELARRLTADGYPTPQSHVSRMREAVQYLLPCIPKLLFSGLGRHQVEKLAVLRNAGHRIWDEHAKGRAANVDFTELFQEVLAQFDGDLSGFLQQRLQDELVGRMADSLGIDYDILNFDLKTNEARQTALHQHPEPPEPAPSVLAGGQLPQGTALPAPALPSVCGTTDLSTANTPPPPRHDSIEQLVSSHTGAEGSSPDVFESIWPLPPGVDQPARLRELTGQMAFELAGEQREHMAITDRGIGVQCSAGASQSPLLAFISSLNSTTPTPLVQLLLGEPDPSSGTQRLSDPDLLKLFQLIRLARRLKELGNDSMY